jgi:hypothetical protein
MANGEHLAKLREGVEAWNGWRLSNAIVVPDLSGADLSGADLGKVNLHRLLPKVGWEIDELAYSGGVDLGRADLAGADLSRTNLTLASLYKARLRGAILTAANLEGANLRRADVSQANFDGADLIAANLNGADLDGANLAWTTIDRTTFIDNDLANTKGLETVRHGGPSMIGIDTIYRSQGKIPLAFLRGAGVPENFIEYMGSLTGKSLEFYSCFISYSTKDQEFADRLYADLQNKGVRCWFAPHNVQGGKKLHEQIDEAIRRYERLLLILSPSSMSSEWVKTEIRKARKRERTERKRVLFPVRLVSFEAIRDWELFDADEGKDLAVEIREYFIPDFSDWKNHDPYAKGFEKLLRDLKTEDPKAT